MPKPLRKKPPGIPMPVPLNLTDASDTQLLKRFSKPERGPWPEPKTNPRPHPLRITPRKRSRKPPASSGFFDTLPLELLDMILLQLDYVSLTRLSATNTTAESYIKTRPYYKLVVENCCLFLGELRRIGFLHVPSAASIYDAVCKPVCDMPSCRHLAGSLFLPTCRRYCRHCLGATPQSTALCTILVEERYHIAKKDILKNLLCVRSSQRPNSLFVVEADVIGLAARLFGEEQRRVPCHGRGWTRDLASLPLPFVDAETNHVEPGRMCRACNAAFEELAHCWEEIDAQPAQNEWVAWEKQLQEMEGPACKVYGTKQLLQHIRSGECLHAQELWSKEYRPG
ncbi:hypothetical protein BJX63DRAFT_218167 [Aspergillus granulosus]|uniref:F-box domain-containing protein n=1 Tax=Aspergillus granulosus TaxID=176169 RepID=A0ABR4I1K5_9EURO